MPPLQIRPNQEVLVLNSTYEPLNITRGRNAIKLLLKEKAEVLSSGVIRLLYYIRLPLNKLARVKPSKMAIYRRDGHKCQYCGSTRSLTIDHVMAKSRGGEDTWENLVACCSPCNVKKSNTLLDQTNMRLRTKPRPPVNKIYQVVAQSDNLEWQRYGFVLG
jgi:hypothetical protein